MRCPPSSQSPGFGVLALDSLRRLGAADADRARALRRRLAETREHAGLGRVPVRRPRPASPLRFPVLGGAGIPALGLRVRVTSSLPSRISMLVLVLFLLLLCFIVTTLLWVAG